MLFMLLFNAYTATYKILQTCLFETYHVDALSFVKRILVALEVVNFKGRLLRSVDHVFW